MSTATIPAIERTVTVAVPVERAFRVFTESFNSWWPPAYAIGATEMAEAVDPAHGSEIEVRFTAEGPDTTLVELEHRLLERHGASGATLGENVGGDHGWTGILRRFAEVAEA